MDITECGQSWGVPPTDGKSPMSSDPTIPVLWSVALYGWLVLGLIAVCVGVVSVIRAAYVPVSRKVLWMSLMVLLPILGTAVWLTIGYQPRRVRRALGYPK